MHAAEPKHKVFLAGEQFEGVKDKVRRRLFSYWYNRKSMAHILEAHEFGNDLFLDSGAFTAFSQNQDIQVEDYAEYVLKWGHLFSVVSALDDIREGADKSWENLKRLEQLGCTVCPVFHFGEPIKFLEMMLEEQYPYILIGGMVGKSRQQLEPWLDMLFDQYLTNPDGTANVKLHGFGLTDQRLMFRYPWYSVDSTSWLFTGAFGNCLFRRNGKTHKVCFSHDSPSKKNINAAHYFNMPAVERAEIDRWLEPYGVTAEQCAEHYRYRNMVNAMSFQDMEFDIPDTFKLEAKGLF